MNHELRQRLDAFRATDSIPSRAVDFVERELAMIDPQATLDDEQAGLFVSHAVMAVTRLAQGDDTVTAPDENVYAEVVSKDPSTPITAQRMADRVAEEFRRPLPDAEVKFLTIHIALLNHHLTRESS
ncbi:PRD domain-containing protein [Xylanimonas ulmi]|uniref:PRD domain-containing protein n=1 Tax=Xylanimonas ulmi TaxID=228973 RepID=A0A4Q7M6V2_9MICO|nr:PRD domain-containing protein [Xylanibacterium ulmi]RZS62372.1 PRD domain-containing protein [Xylanibacterium ulmi]